MEEILHDLRTAGLRATPQRVKLLSVLRASDAPLAVEAIITKGKRTYDTATAYRILETFEQEGLARRIALARDRALFEAVGTHHHHAVCRDCGRIEDIAACLPASIDAKVKRASGFARIDDHTLEFFGLCTPCASRS